jgi:hypothetical protein
MQNTPYAAQQQQVNKFLEATRRLGAQMDNDQGTTRAIYDTTGNLPIGTTSATLFDQLGSKVFPATNLDQNRFQPGEGMVIKEIAIQDLNSGTPANFQGTFLALAVIDVFIGNNRVIKSLPLTAFSTIAALNPLNTPYAGINNGSAQRGSGTAIRLRTNLVIPPQVQFYATIRFPVGVGVTGPPPQQVNLKMSFKGYGKLFNPGQNY